jgi:Predicted membrane protein (DUF2079)
MGRLAGPIATILAISALVAQPLIGYPALVRLPAILLPTAAVLLIQARPWRWDERAWRGVDEWQPSAAAVWWSAVIAAAILFWIVLTRFQSGDINAVDFTVYFDRPLFQTLHGRSLFVETADLPSFSHRSEFAVHAYWLLVPIAALYAMWATPLWLLALSVLAAVLGAVHVLRIMQRLGAGGVLAAATAAAYLLNANMARTLLYGFHPEILYAWFIPWAFDAALRRARGEFILATLATVMVKEDAVLVLLALSSALMLGRERPRTIADILLYIGAPVGVGLANLAFYYQQVLPALGGSTVPVYAGFWGNYGPTPARALLGMARQPWRLLGATFSPGVARVLAPHLFLPVIAWRWTVGILPIVMLYAASANPQLKEFGIYRAIPLVPFLVPGASFGALAVARRLTGNERTARLTASVIVLLAAIVIYGDRAGYSLRPWKPEIRATPGVMRALAAEPAVLVQSGLYPHAGYDTRTVLLTPETLRDPQYAGAAVVIAPRVSAYPFRPGELDPLLRLPALPESARGVVVVRRE